MATLEIADFIKFEVSLEEILGAADLILRKTKDREVRTAIKTMFTELKKADKSFVKAVLVPLFEIETQSDFDKQFGRIRSRFKKIVLDGKGLLSQISCGVVTNKMQVLKESQAWKKRIPLVNRSIVRLELAVDNWIANDAELYQADQRLMADINVFFDDIAKQKDSDSRTAFTELKAGLTGIEDSFLRTKKHLAHLEVLSVRL